MATNTDMPIIAKLKVLNAAFFSSMLYSCESWINVKFNPVNTMYMSAIQSVLNVRQSTANNLCLMELGIPPIDYAVKQRQQNFFKKISKEHRNVAEDPLTFVLDLTKQNVSTPTYIKSVMNPLIRKTL